jgi:ABC-2 type transport system ATP-binding protein
MSMSRNESAVVDASAAALSARSLGQRYGSKWVFRDLDLNLHPGVTGLLGPNGAGKTTLLQTLASVRRPSSGTVQLFGEVTRGRPSAKILAALGFLPQTFGYLPGFTAVEFVEYAAWLKGLASANLQSAAAEALDRVGLSSQGGQKMRQLSGGMIQRVGIAAVIVHGPRLLLLDEPTVGLDPQQRIQFRNLIRDLGSHVSILLSTHLVEDVTMACGRVVVLNQGLIGFDGAPAELEAMGRVGGRDGGVSLGEGGYAKVLADMAGVSS